MSGAPTKQYGLVIRSNVKTATGASVAAAKTARPALPKASIFDDDDDDNDDDQTTQQADSDDDDRRRRPPSKYGKKPVMPTSLSERANANKMIEKEAQKRQRRAELEQQAILKEDPNAYSYDEVYEQVSEAKLVRDPQEQRRREDKAKPKHIESLMRMAAERKRDQERLYERQAQRELEKEEGEFADKEQFMTGAYKDKLAELRKDEEAEKKREAYEQRHGVSRSGMNGFYRNLLDRTNVAYGGGSAAEESSAEERKKEKEAQEEREKKERERTEREEEERRERREHDRKRRRAEEEESLREIKRKRAEEEQKQEQEKKSRLVERRNESGAVSAAKERYLQRKEEQKRVREELIRKAKEDEQFSFGPIGM